MQSTPRLWVKEEVLPAIGGCPGPGGLRAASHMATAPEDVGTGLLLRGDGAQGTPRHHRACSGPRHGIQHPKFSFLWFCSFVR